MKTHLLLCILFLSFIVRSQDPRIFDYCPIDEQTDLTIKMTIHNNYRDYKRSTFTSFTVVKNMPEYYWNEYDVCLGEYALKFDESSGKFIIFTVVQDSIRWFGGDKEICYTHDSIIEVLNLDKVKRFEVLYSAYNEHPLEKMNYTLGNEPWLKHLQFDSLQSLLIETYGGEAPVKLNLTHWGNFKSIKNSGTLERVKVSGSFYDRDLVGDFQRIKSIKQPDFSLYKHAVKGKRVRIDLNEPPVSEYAKFEKLEKLNAHSDLFNHQLTTLKHFKGFEHVQMLWYQNSAEQLFFEKHLLGGGLYYIPYVDSLIYTKYPKFNDSTGRITLLAEDLFEFKAVENGDYRPDAFLQRLDENMVKLEHGDTIVYGELQNGKQVGKWCYFQNVHSETEKTTYNHEVYEKISFPANGEWNYYYPSGQLAIEGKFKNGKKNGEWVFYTKEGAIEEVEHYKKDLPRGLFISRRKSQWMGDENSRTYYTRNGVIWTSKGQFRRSFGFYFDYGRHQMQGNTNGDLEIKYYDKTYLTIGYYTPQYKRYVYKHCLKYLYPELKKSEVWEEVKR